MRNKRVKQILAIIGLVIIAGLYITTLVLALTGSESTKSLFLVSIVCTIVVPLIMYIFTWAFKLAKGNTENTPEDMSGDDSQE